MKRVVSSTAGVLLVAVVGAGAVTGSLLARADAAQGSSAAGARSAALRLAAVRLDLCTGVTELAIARVREGGEGDGQLDRDAAQARWETTHRASAATLDDLRRGPAGGDAGRARAALTELGAKGPADVGSFLADYANPVLDVCLSAESVGGRAVDPLEAALSPLDELIASTGYQQVEFAAAEAALGIGAHDRDLTDWLRSQGYAVAGQPLVTGAVEPRLVPPAAGSREEPGVAGLLADLRRQDPAIAREVLALAAGPDGTAQESASRWTSAVLDGTERSSRPVAPGDLAVSGSRLAAALHRSASTGLAERVDRLDADRDAATRWARLWLAVAVLAGAGTLGVLVRVVHVRRHHERLLQAVAGTDPLTGLANRRALDERTAPRFADRETATHAVLALDLDGFKPVNDTYGHAVGDEVLRAVAKRGRAALRPRDVLARTGGDEFVVVLLDLPPQDAAATVARVAADLERTLAEPLHLGTLTVRVGVSVGSALREGRGDLPGTIAMADRALYDVKRSRPGRVAPREG
ncbi:GGDEF domain-containing protein [Kineococcus sp. SYSU DK002]|uniref:GGDEF domain-containing protein n=1 Tax=Kineococcus sp. SYSU DK002 TaxID=3383123 RepID=UPI003D7C46F6